MNLSKSRYVLGKRCEKLLWLSCYKPEEQEEQNNESVLENGNQIGDLARHLFGDKYILIEYNDDKQKMIDDTLKYLKNKPNIICEASFSYDGNFCSVDVLKNDKDGVEIYEVKSSSHINTSYIDDLSYQTWLLKKCGLKIKKSCLVYVNNHYYKHGKFDINKFFVIKDLTNSIDLNEVEKKVPNLKKVINSKKEPNLDIGNYCNKTKDTAYECPFFKYCTKHLPTPNIFDIGWHEKNTYKLELYYQNKVSFEDIKGLFHENANRQVEYELHNLKPYINKPKIEELLKTLKYPLYFLDFESFQPTIPIVDGTKPYQQICFQYSLHYYLKENGELYHKEYLSDDYNGNPMYGLCKQLCEDIPLNSCVIVYNDRFEKPRLKEMADLFPEFKEHLLNIRDHIIDLWPIFDKQYYYVKEMKGSSSIKCVLPALFLNAKDLDYHYLDQVHNGEEASNAFLSLPTLSKEEQEKLRENMLKYCGLDTYAMVKIYDKLKEIIKK